MPKEQIVQLAPDVLWKARANESVDIHAKEARDAHSFLEEAVMKGTDRMLHHQRLMAKLVAATLKPWPKLPHGLERVP